MTAPVRDARQPRVERPGASLVPAASDPVIRPRLRTLPPLASFLCKRGRSARSHAIHERPSPETGNMLFWIIATGAFWGAYSVGLDALDPPHAGGNDRSAEVDHE